MGIYSKLKLLMRASAEEPVRQLVEKNDIRICQQEIYEAQALVQKTKLQVASIKSEIKFLCESIDSLEQSNALREKQILAALEKDEALAKELASLLAEDELTLREQQAQRKQLESMEQRTMQDLKRAVRSIQSYQNQLIIMKANEQNVGSAGALKGYSRGLNGSLRDLNESLESIKHRQKRALLMDEAEEAVESSLAGGQIDSRIESLGIQTGKHDGLAVLERIRKQAI